MFKSMTERLEIMWNQLFADADHVTRRAYIVEDSALLGASLAENPDAHESHHFRHVLRKRLRKHSNR